MSIISKQRLELSESVTYELSELPNGVQIATAEMPHMASASLGFWASVGSRHERPAEHGAAHFIEHLLFKGTHSRSASAIAREIEGVGASIDAYTSEDHTCYYTRGPAELFEPMADVLADMFQHPCLKTADIDNERGVIKEEISMVYDQPSQYLDDLLSGAAWGEHNPLGRPITGTLASLDTLRQAELQDFFKRSYVGSQCVVTAAGNITHQQTLDAIASRLEKLPAGKVAALAQPALQTGKSAFCVAKRDTEQVHFSIAFHAYDRHDDRRYAQKLLSILLGENMSSLLFQKLREEEAVCYSIQTDVMTFKDAGLFNIYCALDPEHLERALAVIKQTLKQLRQQACDECCLQESKSYAIGQSRVALESTSSQMTWLGEGLMAYERLVDPTISQQRLQAVSGEQVQQLASELFQAQRLVIAAVGPKGTKPILAKWRAEFDDKNK
ncbi:MAG: insulinase family protein [Verrucomicrobiales bacterium]|nr:insulinase family protein [Verrucomicrobiales bacterium]